MWISCKRYLHTDTDTLLLLFKIARETSAPGYGTKKIDQRMKRKFLRFLRLVSLESSIGFIRKFFKRFKSNMNYILESHPSILFTYLFIIVLFNKVDNKLLTSLYKTFSFQLRQFKQFHWNLDIFLLKRLHATFYLTLYKIFLFKYNYFDRSFIQF